MKEITQLQRLYDFGIPVTILARECNCSLATMHNYIHNRSIPTGTKMLEIKNGLKQMLNKIYQIVEE